MKQASLMVVVLALALGAPGLTAQEEGPSDEWLIASAVLAVPESLRDGAEVRKTVDGELVTIREGTNGMICLADTPGDDGFRASCYHEGLEPFMAAGRELRAQGLSGMEYQQARWDMIEAGEFSIPPTGGMVYNLGFGTEDFDPDTMDWTTGGRLQAMYVPGMTHESTGLPRQAPAGEPWLMWSGQPSSHIMMVIPPKTDEDEEEGGS